MCQGLRWWQVLSCWASCAWEMMSTSAMGLGMLKGMWSPSLWCYHVSWKCYTYSLWSGMFYQDAAQCGVESLSEVKGKGQQKPRRRSGSLTVSLVELVGCGIYWCNAVGKVGDDVVRLPLNKQLLLHARYCSLCLFIDCGDSFMAAIPLIVENY